MATDAATANGTHAFDPWSMEVKPPGGGEYAPLAAGNQIATIVGIYDIGHHAQVDDKTGKGYWSRKLVLVLELAKRQPNGKPYVFAKEYTWSLAPTASFRTVAQSLTGKTFSDGDRFDPRSLLGSACLADVTAKAGTSAKGEARTYNNVKAITGYPEGFPPPPAPSYEGVVWSIVGGEMFPAGLDWLPRLYGETISQKADASREGRGLPPTTPAPDGNTPMSQPVAQRDPGLPPVPGASTIDPDADGCPF